MTTYTLILTNINTRATMTVTIEATSYAAAVETAWRKYARRSGNAAVVA